MVASVAEFAFTELLPLGPDATSYRLVTADGVSTFDTSEGTFLKVEPSALTRLTAEAMHDIAHFLRSGTPAPDCGRSSTIRRRATTTGSSPSTC